MVPLDGNRAIMAESRHRLGYDTGLPDDGVALYRIDTSILSGFGPITALNDQQNLTEGESLTVEGITFEVTAGTDGGQIVQVTVDR